MCEELLEPYDIYECSKCRDGLKEENGADLVHSHALREHGIFPMSVLSKKYARDVQTGDLWVKVEL